MSNADKNAIAIIVVAIGLPIVLYAYYLGLKGWQLRSFPTSLHFMLRSWPWYYPGGLASPQPIYLRWLWW